MSARGEYREQGEHGQEDQGEVAARLVASSGYGAYGAHVTTPLTDNAMQQLTRTCLSLMSHLSIELKIKGFVLILLPSPVECLFVRANTIHVLNTVRVFYMASCRN